MSVTVDGFTVEAASAEYTTMERLVRDLQLACLSLRGRPEFHEGRSRELSKILELLTVIKELRGLHTAGVMEVLRQIKELVEQLQTWPARNKPLAIGSSQPSKDHVAIGAEEEDDLVNILVHLSNLTKKLCRRVSNAPKVFLSSKLSENLALVLRVDNLVKNSGNGRGLPLARMVRGQLQQYDPAVQMRDGDSDVPDSTDGLSSDGSASGIGLRSSSDSFKERLLEHNIAGPWAVQINGVVGTCDLWQYNHKVKVLGNDANADSMQFNGAADTDGVRGLTDMRNGGLDRRHYPTMHGQMMEVTPA